MCLVVIRFVAYIIKYYLKFRKMDFLKTALTLAANTAQNYYNNYTK